MGFVTAEVKSKILLDLQDPGHVVSALAKMYGVSAWTIYQLRKTLIPSQGTGVEKKASFVNVTVEEEVGQQTTASPPVPVVIEKATFTSQGLCLTLEGQVHGHDIKGILTFLENR